MTPLFPGWHLPTLRRKPKTDIQKHLENERLNQTRSITDLSNILSRYIPKSSFDDKFKKGTRKRLFSLENTFWGFFYQLLNPDGGCQSVVNQLRASLLIRSKTLPSNSTSAYCQARKKLPIELLKSIFKVTSEPTIKSSSLLGGRRIIVADGTGISMPDTSANQADFPQSIAQKIGCGFPQARICACFDLYSGVALSYQVGNKKSHELPLFRKQFEIFKTNDIFLGDKGFVCFADMVNLKTMGVDSIVGLAKRKPVKTQDAKKVLGENDLLITWDKTAKNRTYNDSNEWKQYPSSIQVRQIKVKMDIPGYRPKDFYIVTTLLDHKKYPAEEIRKVYLKRWNVELYFRDLKTTLGMDVLRCKTPDMVEKEILMYFIVYNSLKRLAYDGTKEQVDPDDISFKSCQQILLGFTHASREKNTLNLLPKLLSAISKSILFKRANRVEPRVIKRRPKPFKLMVKPRAELKLDLIRASHPKMA